MGQTPSPLPYLRASSLPLWVGPENKAGKSFTNVKQQLILDLMSYFGHRLVILYCFFSCKELASRLNEEQRQKLDSCEREEEKVLYSESSESSLYIFGVNC